MVVIAVVTAIALNLHKNKVLYYENTTSMMLVVHEASSSRGLIGNKG